MNCGSHWTHAWRRHNQSTGRWLRDTGFFYGVDHNYCTWCTSGCQPRNATGMTDDLPQAVALFFLQAFGQRDETEERVRCVLQMTY